jgi:predicted N-acetyltransferase YhbS
VEPDLTAAIAFDRAIRRRAAAEAIPLEHGLAVRHPGLPDVHHLNAILLDARPSRPWVTSDVVALADRWLADRAHRHVVLDDAEAGERIAVELADRGWERRRTLFMLFAQDPATLPPDDRARQISEAQLQAHHLAGLAEDMPAEGRSGLVARLAAAQAALRAGTSYLAFGAGEGDEPHATCTLFLGADARGRRLAMIDEVGTLIAHRERGLARAVVCAAIAEAHASGARLIVIPADADDWPQLMYARLGFVPAGRQVSLTLRTRAL